MTKDWELHEEAGLVYDEDVCEPDEDGNTAEWIGTQKAWNKYRELKEKQDNIIAGVDFSESIDLLDNIKI